MRKKLSVFWLLFFSVLIGFAQGKWELKKNENGIEVYVRKAAKGNIKELRVLTEFNVTQSQLLSVLLDIPAYKNWIYSDKKTEVLKVEGPDKIIYYTQSRLPWPLKDRDLVTELNINTTPELLNVQARSMPDYLPKNDEYIRVPYSLANWNITQGADNKLKIDYTFSVDPGGSVPSWIVNMTLAMGPYNSFVKLKEILKAKYGK